MINRIQLLRNVGLFDSVSPATNVQLARLTLIYAENGRGKTTLAAILRSLATGDPIPIAERRRLTAQNPPHVVLDCVGGPPDAVFQNNAWNRTLPNIAVFDDVFVDANVYSGLAVQPEHRQNLHELILGAQGVGLNQQVQQLVARIESHNAALREKAAAIPAADRGSLSVDEFCVLPARLDLDQAIRETQRSLAAAREQVAVREAPVFGGVALPGFDVDGIERVLQEDLPAVEITATAVVETHLAQIGPGAETWIAEGMRRVPRLDSEDDFGACPFCAQDLSTSPLIIQYRAYFSDAYATLMGNVAESRAATYRIHGGEAPASFERAVRLIGERRQFWSRFCDVPEAAIDTAAVVRDWCTACDAVLAALNAKLGEPLRRIALSNEARTAVLAYEAHRQSVAALNEQVQRVNTVIRLVKEQAATANVEALTADLARFRVNKARYEPGTAALCDDYLAEKTAKGHTEQLRDQAKGALEQYRATVFPGYQTAINRYLQRFNAGFRVESVASTTTRGGLTCTYSVVINNIPLAVAGGNPVPGEPSFRNTLSAGDRNALALAFFFASLDQDPNLGGKVVVIDDPASSLDEHRSLTTVQELRRLAERTSQVVVLSHNKAFLCRIWVGADATNRAALQVARGAAGSTILTWDVSQDSITEHDRRHAALCEYLTNPAPNRRDIAESLRHMLEAFLRVAYPDNFPPEARLGVFRNLCQQRLGTPQQILSADDTRELNELTEYANRFHHDTNQAWETEAINDIELRGFVERALRFTKR